jgi:hypothetical protein
MCVLIAVGTGRCVAATLIADYQFHGNYASGVAGAADLAPLGTVSFTSVTISGQPVDAAAFTMESGLRMTVPANIAVTGYSVVLQFRLDTTSGYRKLVDFADRASDPGLYTLSSLLDFYPAAAGTVATIPDATVVQVVMTRSAAGTVAGYVNGAPQFSFADSAPYAVPATDGFNLFIDDFVTGAHEASAGVVARVRLYQGDLTAQEVAALTGPCYANCDGSTSEPILNVLDFTCFLQRFAAADPYANCDGSTTAPILNVLDFTCFLQKFAAGC